MVPVNRPALTRLASQFILLLLVQALLLPIYGPWLDRQFAARQADHKHLYFGKVDLNHHGHHGRDRHAGHAKRAHAPHGRADEPSNTVINLPNLDVTNQGQVLVLSFTEILSFLLAAAQNSSLVFTLADHTITSQGISRAPPHQPPRPAP